MGSLPGLLDPLWHIGHDALVVWGFVLVAVALLRRHWRLVASLATAAAAVTILGPVVGRLASGEWPPFAPSLFTVTQTVHYPSVALAFWVAIASVTSPHLSRPFRFFGRWLVGIAGLSAFALGMTAPGDDGRRDGAWRSGSPPPCTSCSARLPTFRTSEKCSGCCQHGRPRHADHRVAAERRRACASRGLPTARSST